MEFLRQVFLGVLLVIVRGLKLAGDCFELLGHLVEFGVQGLDFLVFGGKGSIETTRGLDAFRHGDLQVRLELLDFSVF